MKFGKRLKKQIAETLPEWRDKFLSYKELKKLVHLISTSSRYSSSSSSSSSAHSKAEAKFIRLLDKELDKLNAFFEDREERFIIQQKELQVRIMELGNGTWEKEDYDTELGRIRKEIVDLHGEMVLLENYSSINYTGIAKILKKYDKRTGALLRLPFIEKVLKQPFYATEIISELVKECENTMDAVFPPEFKLVARGGGQASASEEQTIFRSTVAALETMQELRQGSSTYGHFSLPPMNSSENEILDSIQLQVPSPIPIP